MPNTWRNTTCNDLFPTILSSIKQLLPQFILKNDKATSTTTRLHSSNDSKELGKGYLGDHPPEFLPRTTQKIYGRDTQGTIRPTPFLKRLERVREGIPRRLSARLPSSNDSKKLWKGYPGYLTIPRKWHSPRALSKVIGGLRKDKDKDKDNQRF